jgi:hypothetical protein
MRDLLTKFLIDLPVSFLESFLGLRNRIFPLELNLSPTSFLKFYGAFVNLCSILVPTFLAVFSIRSAILGLSAIYLGQRHRS